MTLLKAGKRDDAQAMLQSLHNSGAVLPEIEFQLGRMALAAGRTDVGIAHLETADARRPDEPTILEALAGAYAAAGLNEKALATYDRWSAVQPKSANPLIDKALLLQRQGAMEEAETVLKRAMKRDPRRGEIYRMLAVSRKLKPGDPLIRTMKKAESDKHQSPEARVQLQFALAKAMEDTGKTDHVFRYLKPANRAMKSAYRFDIRSRKAEVDGLIRAFSGEDFTPISAAGNGFAPIFVTGLPRSGTTLVEQILNAHSQVSAAGEQPHALRLAYDILGGPRSGFSKARSLDEEDYRRFASDYEDAMRAAIPFDRIVTDKAIQTHLIIGFLKRALPDSKVIVVRRDPRDLLYSIYKNMFAPGTHRYAYDLEDLAGYYASFVQILDFWRRTLPDGFHELHYEELVAHPEEQTRALVAAAGLEWEDGCLDFHAAKGEVKTLSVSQVRQPIYRSSARAWEKYAADLAPLTAALEREGVL